MSETPRQILLFATGWERDEVLSRTGPLSQEVAIIGCGPVIAAAETARLLAAGSDPGELVLAGIAGSYDLHRAPLGSLQLPGRCRLVGVGAGRGQALHRSSEDLGLPTHPDDPREARTTDLEHPAATGPLALTVCAASGSPDEARALSLAHPEALLEEMEGFAVAWAAARAGWRCRHLRAISNEAGVRDRSRWTSGEAFDALAGFIRREMA